MENINALKEKVKVETQNYLDKKDNLKLIIRDYLKGVLEVRENKQLIFSDIDEDYGYNFGNATISYDGGAHPEYASNAFSEVYGLGISLSGYDEGEIYFMIDDSDHYEISRVWSVDELIDIADMVAYVLEVEEENKKENAEE